MRLSRHSPCKVNLLLNCLGKRPDGFTELETVFFPVPLFDEIALERRGTGIELTCSHKELPTDGSNLVHKAAAAYLNAAGIAEGVCIHLEKRLPLSAGIGAGSANAAITLLLLNEAFGNPLPISALDTLAARLGSDVNFFLQDRPAIGRGRGEQIEPVSTFAALHEASLLLFHPGFGIATPWAFKELASRFPSALNGTPGRATALVDAMKSLPQSDACKSLYNALEFPALDKYPILRLYQEHLAAHGATGTLMSGSGSTTFAIFPNQRFAETAADSFRSTFGNHGWLQVVRLGS